MVDYGAVWRLRRRRASAEFAFAADVRARRLVSAAFRDLAGTQNGVVYDVPLRDRPEPLPGSIFLRGSAAWRAYLVARQQIDTGQPAVLFALRSLGPIERKLAVDWGATYPNTFFLVEPHDPACDLTDASNPFTHRLIAAIEATNHTLPPQSASPAWSLATPVGRALREMFGAWVYWNGPEPYTEVREVPLRLATTSATVWQLILDELVDRFPQGAYDRALAYVNDWERELLGGPIARARSVFRTRLGMPILRDPRCVDRAIRRLVNEGRMTVVAASLPGRPVFGNGRPVPDEISEEEFADFLMS